MTVYLVVLLSVLNSIAQRGSKVVVSLYALDLGAGAAAVGVLAALFAVFPLLLAVQGMEHSAGSGTLSAEGSVPAVHSSMEKTRMEAVGGPRTKREQVTAQRKRA